MGLSRVMTMDDRAEKQRRQKSRNRALLIVILGTAALFYVISIVRMGASG